MVSDHEDRFHLHHGGRLIEVETESRFMEPRARLLIDGKVVDERSTWPQPTRLQAPGLEAIVEWTLLSRPQRAWVVSHDEEKEDDENVGKEKNSPTYDLIPPPGSWAERVARFASSHPNLYASRHVIKASIQALIGIIGIGAIFWGLLPRFDIDIPLPDIDIGEMIQNLIPGWLREVLNLPQRIVVWLFGWIVDIAFVDQLIDWIRSSGFPPDWLKAIISTAKYWVPILIATGVAIQEVNRRNKRSDEESADDVTPDQESDPLADGIHDAAVEARESQDESNRFQSSELVVTLPPSDIRDQVQGDFESR